MGDEIPLFLGLGDESGHEPGDGFSTVWFMEHADFVLPRLDVEWQRILNDPSSVRRLASWRLDYPILEPCVTLDEVLEAVDGRALEESSEVVWSLLALAGSDELARRTVVQVIVPGLATEAAWLMSWARRVDARLIDDGEVDQMLLDAAMAAIADAIGLRRRWPIKSILRRVHRLLIRETRRRERTRCEEPTELDRATVDASGSPSAAAMLVEILNEGRERAVVTDRDVELLWLIGVEGYTTDELAPGLGISPRAVAQRRLRAESRLSVMVAS